jgi:hypothetical protein
VLDSVSENVLRVPNETSAESVRRMQPDRSPSAGDDHPLESSTPRSAGDP